MSMTPGIREWQHLRGSDFQQMTAEERERTVVLVSCSPLEVHGPHLPVIADSAEAEGLLLRIAEKLGEQFSEIRFLRLPPIFVAADVLPHRGSLAFKNSTVVRVLADLGRTLGKQGFRHIWVNNFHGGPRHFLAIEQAAFRSNRRYGTKMVSVFGYLMSRLTDGGSDLYAALSDLPNMPDEALRGDTHGGFIETSMLLHLIGDHVDPAYRTLPAMTVDKKLRQQGKPPLAHDSLRALFRSFREKARYFLEETYSGAPALASSQHGSQIFERLADHGTAAMASVWRGEVDVSACHSPAWRYRWLLTNRVVGSVFERVIGYRNPIF